MPPAQLHRQFRHPLHRRFLGRFLAHPLTDAPEIKRFLQSNPVFDREPARLQAGAVGDADVVGDIAIERECVAHFARRVGHQAIHIPVVGVSTGIIGIVFGLQPRHRPGGQRRWAGKTGEGASPKQRNKKESLHREQSSQILASPE